MPREIVADRRIVLDYRPNPIGLFVAAVLFLAGGLVLLNSAQTLRRGLLSGVLRGTDPLHLMWIEEGVAAGSFAVALVAGAFVYARVAVQRHVILESTSITLPARGFSAEHHRISTAEILGASVYNRKKPRFVQLRTARGKFGIKASCLGGTEDMFAILIWVRAHVTEIDQ